jgi:NAD(P)-dependent dehydrogenase (short-subunit alcohol dehydrogenase family)
MNQPATSLTGKTALVTGAATGIGKAIAAALAAASARVVINHPQTPELADKVVAGIEASGGQAVAIAADISSRSEYQAMVERMLGEYGRWDVLVNNAAVAITGAVPGHLGADGDDRAGYLVADRVGAGEQSPRDYRCVEVAAPRRASGMSAGMMRAL